MSEVLRVCKICGFTASNNSELNLFSKSDRCKHNRRPLCKKCLNKKAKETFSELSKNMSFNNSELIACACGCGLFRKKYDKTGYPRKYIRGHFNRGHFKEQSSSWNGGKSRTNGYVVVYMPDHPNAHKSRYVYEHRLIMEKHLGRFLKKKEIVHHINGIVDDNRIENLRLLPGKASHCDEHRGPNGSLVKTGVINS